MQITIPGKINNRLWFLGRMESCIYLLEGARESILINGGLSFLVPEILHQFQDFNIDASKISKVLLLHSHFDHVGIAPFFRRRNPEITLLAHARAWNVLKNPRVLQSINNANQYVMENRGVTQACANYDLDWRTDISGKALGEGDRIDLGDLEIIIFETPGHSPCSISAYVPDLQALFPSDAGGVPFGEKIMTYGASNYTDFEKSLRKLKDLPAKYICSDHFGCITGDEAASFFELSIQTAEERRILMKSIYNRRKNVDETAKELALRFKEENNHNWVTDDTFLKSYRQMVLHLIGRR
jgi:2-aminobenzoylacetyl-CoA thioesterase